MFQAINGWGKKEQNAVLNVYFETKAYIKIHILREINKYIFKWTFCQNYK